MMDDWEREMYGLSYIACHWATDLSTVQLFQALESK